MITKHNNGFAIYKIMQWFSLITVLNAPYLQLGRRLRKEIQLHYQMLNKHRDFSHFAFLQLSTYDMAIYRNLLTPKIAKPFKINKTELKWKLDSYFGYD